MFFTTLLTACLPLLITASPLINRQSQSDCRGSSDYQAFNLPSCEAQLTFTRVLDTGVQWAFDAYYPDGSSKTFEPFRNNSNIAVSDTFYSRVQGLNYLTSRTDSAIHTSVHEFTDVCRNGVAPTAWRFYTTSADNFCPNKFTDSGSITAKAGTRPAKTQFSARQIGDAAEVEVTWTPVAGAASYNAVVRVPTSEYEDRSGFFHAERGARFSASTTSAVFPGVIIQRLSGEARNVYVNVRSSEGVWSHTPNTVPIDVIIV